LINGSTKAVAGGTQTGGVVQSWKEFNYGKVSFDATHIISATFTLESPWGRHLTGVAGDAPVNDIIGPNFYQWDLSLRKTFELPFREGMGLQFQADAFNAFNRVNWNSPTVNNVGSTSFGQITGSLPARVLQLGGKFTF
jgi:hypothetical protein